MIYNYYNYKGGINNLCVVSERFNGGITGASTKGLETAYKNFKKNYKKYYGNNYNESGATK